MKRFIGVSLVLFLVLAVGAAKDRGKTLFFDAQAAWSYIRDLSSDSMMGRESGEPSGEMAEEYIASKFKEWGLEPAGDNGTYFQNFTIEHTNISEGVSFEVIAGRERRAFQYEDDWRIQKFSGSGHFTAEIVFAGYGIHAPDKGYDDYAGVDVKGKVVLVSEGTPGKLSGKLKVESKMQNRVKAAQELGARGFIGVKKASNTSRYFRIRLEKETFRPDFVIVSAEDNVVNFIFEDLPTETRYLFQQIEKTAKPQSFATGVKGFFSVNSVFDEKRPTRNVLAKIAGTDRDLKGEYVIIGAHMDHLGISPMGDIMNGADDNASGTAVVMEAARAMKLSKIKPKRTVIFGLWAGEEQGLLGSRYYVDHSLYPIDKTAAYLNMDMVGQGEGEVPFDGVYYSPEVWEILKDRLPKEILDYVRPGRGGPGGSDHTPFLGKGVPAYFILTKGYHFKYHRRHDDIELIQPEILKKAGDFVVEAVRILALEPGSFILPMRQEEYCLKQQTLVNFKLSPLDQVIDHHKDVKDSHLDLQLALVEAKGDLSGDELRVDILKRLMDSSDMIKKASGLASYSSPMMLSGDIRQGKTTIMAGLRGLDAFRDDPRWTDILARQGIYFVILDDFSALFDGNDLSDEGKNILERINASGLLLLVKGADEAQAKVLLDASNKPLVLLSSNLPGKEILELIKDKEGALGLILGKDEDPTRYFKKLDEAKKAVSAGCLMMVNELCLWSQAGQDQMLKVIAEIIRADYDREDLSSLFSGTLLRILNQARGEEEPRVMPYIPF